MNLLDKYFDIDELEQDTVIDARKFDTVFFKDANDYDKYEFDIRGAARVIHRNGKDLGIQPAESDGKPIYVHLKKKGDWKVKNIIISSKWHWFNFFAPNNTPTDLSDHTTYLMNLASSQFDLMNLATTIIDPDTVEDDTVIKAKAIDTVMFKDAATKNDKYVVKVYGPHAPRESGNDFGLSPFSYDGHNIYVHFTRKRDRMRKTVIVKLDCDC